MFLVDAYKCLCFALMLLSFIFTCPFLAIVRVRDYAIFLFMNFFMLVFSFGCRCLCLLCMFIFALIFYLCLCCLHVYYFAYSCVDGYVFDNCTIHASLYRVCLCLCSCFCSCLCFWLSLLLIVYTCGCF